jgi:hypothetical protein
MNGGVVVEEGPTSRIFEAAEQPSTRGFLEKIL